MSITSLPVECRCVPPSPFYLRWLNRYGGWDYWMFQKRQTVDLSISEQDTFEPYIADYYKANATRKLVKKEVEKTVTIGAQHLSLDEWKALSYIVQSSCVQWYDKEKEPWHGHEDGPWFDVLVEKPKVVMQTDKGSHSIELELKLPNPQTAL